MTSAFDAILAYRGGVDSRASYTSEGLISSIVRNKRNPDWVCDFPVGDVSYPMILNSTAQVTGSTGAVNTGTTAAHTHTNAFTSFASAAYWTVAQNASLGAYVRASDIYQVDWFSTWCFISSGGALAGGSIDFEVFRENPDLSLTRLLNTNLTSVVSVGGAGRSSQPLLDTITVREGERYLLRLVNRSSPARTLAILGMGGYLANLTGVLPFSTTGTTDTNRTTYTTAQAATANAATQVLPWFLMARSSNPAEDRTFRDNFDRVNLGPAWAVNASGTTAPPVIVSNRLSYSGTTTGFQAAMCIYPTVGDGQRVDLDVLDIASTTVAVTLMLHWQREQASLVQCGIFSNGANIVSVVGASQVNQASVVLDNTDPATWSAYYVPSTKTYTVLKNNQDIGLSWVDSGNLVPHDINRRYAGIEIGRDAGGVNAGTCDNFVLRDWAP